MLRQLNQRLTRVADNMAEFESQLSAYFIQGNYSCQIKNRDVYLEYQHDLTVDQAEEQAKTLFEDDLTLAKELGVRGFPTIFFIDKEGNKEVVYGSRPYAFYEMPILKMNPNVVKAEYSKEWNNLFHLYPTLTSREFAELSGTPRAESENLLNDLSNSGELDKIITKNGALWQFI